MGVLCQHFLNNQCRFGAKCNKDHVDIRTLVKSEIDESLKGNQYLLSCFGPFKEKVCVPNIEDHSFEEIRFQCYESKAQGTFPNYVTQLANLIQTNKERIQALSYMKSDAFDIICQIYNGPEVSDGQSSTNPFASSGVVGTNQPNSASIFGNSQSNTFANTATTGSNIFGNTAVNNPPSNSIFGNSNTSSFGTNAVVNSIFGNSATQVAQPQGAAQQPQNTFSFALPQVVPSQTMDNSGNIFANSNPVQSPGFGAPPSFAQHQQMVPTGIFSQTPAAQGNIFQNQIVPAQSGNVFQTQESIQQPQNIFHTQAQVQAQNPQPASESIFGNSVFAQQQQQLQQQQQQLYQNSFAQQNQNENNEPAFAAQRPPVDSIKFNVNDFKIDDSVYSKIENLSEMDLEIFKTKNYVLGEIPLCPPPKELC